MPPFYSSVKPFVRDLAPSFYSLFFANLSAPSHRNSDCSHPPSRPGTTSAKTQSLPAAKPSGSLKVIDCG
ncbi:hypothetical protein Lser_V15G38094 [Lactuca serriola]